MGLSWPWHSSKSKVVRVAPEECGDCCERRLKRGQPLDTDRAGVDSPQSAPPASELAPQKGGRCESQGSTASYAFEDRKAFDPEDVVPMFDVFMGSAATANSGALTDASTEASAASSRALTEDIVPMFDVFMGSAAAANSGAVTDASAEASAASSWALGEDVVPTFDVFLGSAATAKSGAVADASTEASAVSSRALSEESETESCTAEAADRPVFRWAVSGREIDVADLSASDTVEEAREKIAKASGRCAKLLRLLGPGGPPLEDGSAIGAGGLVYARDPDEVEREERAAAKRTADNAIAALMFGV